MIRLLDDKEVELVTRLLCAGGRADLVATLPSRFVRQMDDGGMGSLAFQPEVGRRFGTELASVELLDDDGVKVSVSLNLDDTDDLYELDVWKTDFTPFEAMRQGAPKV